MSDALDDQEQRAAVVATLTGDWDDPAVTALSDAQLTCADEALAED